MAVVVLTVSTLSYYLAVINPQGFEIALIFHIILALIGSVFTLKRCSFHWFVPHFQSLTIYIFLRNVRSPFILAALSCAAFVFLKLFDHELAQFFLFQKFTGHFWSKIGDILQIHYVLVFFEKYYYLRKYKPC
jgi:hypothetical protein